MRAERSSLNVFHPLLVLAKIRSQRPRSPSSARKFTPANLGRVFEELKPPRGCSPSDVGKFQLGKRVTEVTNGHSTNGTPPKTAK
jgi:hypothetical protein